MKKRNYVVVLLCLLLQMPLWAQEKKELTPRQIYVQKALKTPLKFEVPKDKAEDTWGRIQVFISKFSSMKIQTATDYIIETFNPTKREFGAKYGYKATKTPLGDKVEFEVSCFPGEDTKLYNFFADGNAHFLALFALTGELIDEAVARK